MSALSTDDIFFVFSWQFEMLCTIPITKPWSIVYIWGSVTTSDQCNSLRARVDQLSHFSKTMAYCLYTNLLHRTRRSYKM